MFSQAFVNFSQFNLDFREFRNCLACFGNYSVRDGIIIIIKNETKKALKEQLRSFRARYTIIPRYHPHWKMITLNSFSHSMCVTCTDVLTYLHTGHHNDPNSFDCNTRLWFNQSAPECSLYLLFQTALSVGDAVFLSTSEDQSLYQRFTVLML